MLMCVDSFNKNSSVSSNESGDEKIAPLKNLVNRYEYKNKNIEDENKNIANIYKNAYKYEDEYEYENKNIANIYKNAYKNAYKYEDEYEYKNKNIEDENKKEFNSLPQCKTNEIPRRNEFSEYYNKCVELYSTDTINNSGHSKKLKKY
jgi:hypothetical protein